MKAKHAGWLLLVAVAAAGPGMAQQADSAGVLPAFKGYGWINPAYLSFDDGQDRKGLLVDNYNAISRAGLWLTWKVADDAALKFNFETNLGVRASNSVSMTDTPEFWHWTTSDIRQLQLIYAANWGVISAGQGDMATYEVAEIDYSGAKLPGYSDYEAVAGGFAFRQTDGDLSKITVKKVFTNLEFSRYWRVRYDTSEMGGFTASVAYGTDILDQSDTNSYYDAALRYQAKTGDYQVGAGIGYTVTQPTTGSSTENLMGSASVLHVPSGLNATLAVGSVMDGGSYVYAKAGWIGDLIAVGKTAFAVEYYQSTNIGVTDGKGQSWGLMLNQSLPHNIDAFVGYRNYEIAQTGSDFMPASSYLIGAKWVF